MTKRCCRCRKKKPLTTDYFNRKVGTRDGFQGICRLCSASNSKFHYAANPAVYKLRVKARRQAVLERVRNLKKLRCSDCHRKYHPVCMDFDHRDPALKSGSVATLIHRGTSFEKILKEIEKCDLVCSNCHRLRTFIRVSSNGKI